MNLKYVLGLLLLTIHYSPFTIHMVFYVDIA